MLVRTGGWEVKETSGKERGEKRQSRQPIEEQK
jgi:hypothetical protein